MVEKKRGRAREVNPGDLVGGAVNEGLARIMKEHPQFRGAQEYIVEHLDERKIQRQYHKLQEYLNQEHPDWNDERKAKFLYTNLERYVASGKPLDKHAKEVVVRKSLHEKQGRESGHEDDYVGRVGAAFRDLYHIMKAGDYGQRMPEFEQSVNTINDLGFLDSALDVLNSYGLIEKREYADVKRKARKKIEEETETFGRTYQKYLAPRKVAAGIIGFLGMLLVLFYGMRGITGAAIGIGGNRIMGGIAGVFLIIISLVFFIFGKNGKRKNR